MDRVLTSTRFIVVLGVIASLFMSATLFLAGLVRTGFLIFETVGKFNPEKTPKLLSIAAIELADIFLIATAIYIVGIGLYELFIKEVDLPDWLTIKSLDDLKDKLVSVVVVVLGVSFLAQVATWDGTSNLLPYGIAIGAVILALTAFGFLRRDKSTKSIEGYEEKKGNAAH